MTKLHDLAELGQSIWLDYIRRSFIESGEFEALIADGLRGFTSNPSIFKQAIAGSTDYDQAIAKLAQEGATVRQIYEALVFEDIQRACDLMRPVFDSTEGLDGYGSLEVSPSLAHDTKGTLEEVRHFFNSVDRPNLMIKIPATSEGIPAIRQSISEGININVTLLFALDQYEAVAEAYLAGLESYLDGGGDVRKVASVASFFVSRLDSKADPLLKERGETDLLGELGVANAQLAYERFTQIFRGPRWDKLAAAGARVQRVLWGSTSTKDPSYPDTLYIDRLIGPHTINTIPPETLQAFLDHGTVARTVDATLDQARAKIARLAAIGIDLDELTDELLVEGVQKFAEAFDALIASIEQKRDALQTQETPAQVAADGLEKK